MSKIAVWYHCILSGPRIPSQDHAVSILQQQMGALNDSFLASVADEVHVGINGSEDDALLASSMIPNKSKLHVYPQGESELSTLKDLQRSLRPGWLICYHHIKGVQAPGNPIWERWRKCMERVCIWNWTMCVDELTKGRDTVGAHWMTNERYPMIPINQRYWGGNFWWARSDYLMMLPAMSADTHGNRYEAEVWIGQGPRRPSIRDFANHFPMTCPA